MASATSIPRGRISARWTSGTPARPDKVGTEGWLGRVVREFDPKKENVVTAVSFGPCLFRALSVPRRSGRLRGRCAGDTTASCRPSASSRSACRCWSGSRTCITPIPGSGVMEYLGTTGLDSLKGADILKVAPSRYKSDGAISGHADRPANCGASRRCTWPAWARGSSTATTAASIHMRGRTRCMAICGVPRRRAWTRS